MLPPGPSSRKIVSATPKSVPYPVLQENTLVLSNFLVVGKRNGKLSLMFRSVMIFHYIVTFANPCQKNSLVLSNFLVMGKRNGKLSLMSGSVTVFLRTVNLTSCPLR